MTRKQKTVSLARSSAAEYLTFVAASGEGGIEAAYADENVWLSQKMMPQLYDVEVPSTASDGKSYYTKYYNLSAIIAVGYKVNSERAVQFRKWAARVVEELTIEGLAMGDERLARGGSVLAECYFDEQLPVVATSENNAMRGAAA